MLHEIPRLFSCGCHTLCQLLELDYLLRRGLKRNGVIEIVHVTGVGRRTGRARCRVPGARNVPPALGQQRGGSQQEESLTDQE